jgi:hypothetical protein
MPRKAAQKPVNARYTYGVVETALAAVFGIDRAGQVGWLRGRLQHLRRLGLVAQSPGRGRTIDYTREDAEKWLVAIELEYLHADPVTAVELIRTAWRPAPRMRSAREAFTRGEAFLADLVAEARDSRGPEGDVIVTVQFGPMSRLPVIGYTTVRGMHSFGRWLATDRVERVRRRASVFNLTDRLRALDEALAATTETEAPQPSGLAPKILGTGKRRAEAL